jgi:uncharacterized protein (TIGR02284 family)
MEKDKKAIDVLNSLITINNDRIEGYERAANETEEGDLKSLFNKLRQTSQTCRQELASEVIKLGGEPAEGTRVDGKFFRAWMDVKAAITGKDRKAILSSCEYGEDVAVHTYEKVLKDKCDELTSAQQSMVQSQYQKIKADHDKVKALRDAVVEV